MVSLLNRPVPPAPTEYSAYGAPPGVVVDLNAYRRNGRPWWETRPIIRPRLQLVHTNGAQNESSVQGQVNWGNADPDQNTHAHYLFNRPRVTKVLPTDRRGIGNATHKNHRGGYGNVSDWSLVYETADSGTLDDPSISDFLYDHAEMVARVLAYESIVHDIPLSYPTEWHGAGTACHTEPFGYPYWTIRRGKTCPGFKKKKTVREQILPRARQIRAAWKEDDMRQRMLDTRTEGGPFGAEETRHVALDVPAHATVAITLQHQNDVPGAFLTVWGDGDRPATSDCFSGPSWSLNTTLVEADMFGGVRVHSSHGGQVIVDRNVVL